MITSAICWLFCAKIIITTPAIEPPKVQEIVQEEDEPSSRKPPKGADITADFKESSLGGNRQANQTGPEANAQQEQKGVWQKAGKISGYVSTYTATYGGCLGCTKYYDEKGQLYYKMANGEKLDDNRLTIAFYNLGLIPLNSRVSLVNRTNGKSVVATVTDTGGFMDCCNRIADLSLATANAIGARTDKDIVEIIPL